MADLPHPWSAYERLQQQSLKKSKLDHQYWGIDAGMEALLESESVSKTMPQPDVDRAIENAARQDRHRTHLRAIYLCRENESHYGASPQAEAVEASELLQLIAKNISEDDWSLLNDIACDQKYAEIAARRNVSAGSLRIKVNRLRGTVRAIVA